MRKNLRLVLLLALIAVMLVMTAVCVSAVDVATEAEFKAAVENGGEINLAGNITLSESIAIDKSVTVNGNDYTITLGANKLTTSAGTLTLNHVKTTHSSGYAVTANGELILQNCVITGSDASNGISVYGDLAVIDSEITTGTGGIVIRAAGGSGATLSVTGSRLIGSTNGGAIVVSATYTTTITVTDTYMSGYRGIRFYNYSGSAANVTMTGVTYRPMQASGKVMTWEGTTVPTTSGKTYTFIDCDLNTTVRHDGTANTSSAAMFSEASGQKNTWVFENCTLTHNGSTAMLYFMKGSTVKLENCTATHSGSSYLFSASEAMAWNVTGGTYTHSGSSYIARISDSNCIFNLTDATLIKNGSSNMIVLNNGKLNIKGSTLTHSSTSAMIYFGSSQSGPLYIEDSALTSGTANSLSLQGTHPVTLVNTTVDKINIPAGYASSVSLTDVTCGTLTDPDGVAIITSTKAKSFEINGTAYTFEELMSVIKDGDVVKIVGNVGALDLNTTVAFTIDFNGYDVPTPVFHEGNRLTFLNYKVSVSSGKALTVPAGTTLTLGEGCALTSTGSGFVIESSGTLTINAGTYGGTIHGSAGTITINGGTFRQTGTFVHGNAGTPILWMNNLEATITVNGGDFKKTATDHAKCCIIGTNDANALMSIKGGRFEVEGEGGYAVANFQSNDGLEITGGTFISANTENPVIRIAYMYGTRYTSDTKASSLKDFTTVGGSVGILFELKEKWTFTVENVTVTDAAKGLFHVDNYDADPKIVIKGRYTFASDADDAAMLSVANGRVILDGATFINSSENAEATIVMTDKTPTVTFENAMVLAKSGVACKSTTGAVYFGTACAKLSGVKYKLWMATEGAADASLDVGASVRAKLDSQGIRFTGTAAKLEGATYGILIAPVDYVAAAGAFTKEALDAFATKQGLSAGSV
ncbi:MAG: hypothetical protein E7644_07955, partial [Ruminococcaceae bacterium]|nr:hypothetical protein [Oscillospiraceae bacterium]